MKKLTIALACFCGFISLSYEILWARVFSFMVSGRAFAFPLCLGLFLVGIALGARWSRYYSKQHETASKQQLVVVAVFLMSSSLVGWLTIPVMSVLGGWFGEASRVLGLYTICLGATFFGAQLPLLAHFGIEPDEEAGAQMSYLYVSNIIGSVSGSLLTGFVLLDVLPLPTLVTGLTIVGLIAGFLLLVFALEDQRKRAIAFVNTILLVGFVIAIKPVAFDSFHLNLLRTAIADDIEEVVHVIENKSGIIMEDNRGRVYSGGLYEGTFKTNLINDVNGILRPFSLSAFHPNPKKILIIGLGTGSWAQVLVQHPQAEEIVIVEINPGFLKLADRSPGLDKTLKDKRVRVVVDDGRRWFHRTDEKFDAIIANTTWHWRSMASSLLSKEFFELTKQHMNPGAILMYNTTGSGLALKTGLTSFEDGYLIYNNLVVSQSKIDFDPKRLRKTLLAYKLHGKPVFEPSQMPQLEEKMKLFSKTNDPDGFLRDKATLKMLLKNMTREDITDRNMGQEWDALWLPNLF